MLTGAAKTVPPPSSFAEADLPTVDSVIEQKRKELNAKTEKPREKKETKVAESKTTESKTAVPKAESNDQAQSAVAEMPEQETDQEEQGQQAAFNPETGEINWDCPCLGGMAQGPCGEQFKTAFSCFVYSDEEPKGMECIDKFQCVQAYSWHES